MTLFLFWRNFQLAVILIAMMTEVNRNAYYHIAHPKLSTMSVVIVVSVLLAEVLALHTDVSVLFSALPHREVFN